MVFRYEYRDGVWVDLEQPTEDEIHAVARELAISERLETELLYPTPAALAADDGNAALLILHFPVHGENHGETKRQEIDLIVGKRFIVTARYEVVAPLRRLAKLLETEEAVDGTADLTTAVLLEVIFAHLYASVRDHASHSADLLGRVEREMFSGRERATVHAISTANREFLHLESSLADQEEPLGRFLRALAGPTRFGLGFAERAARIKSERAQIAHLVRTHRAVATELRETNSALLESRQNEIMKTLTMITVVVLPLELIAFVFGMHLPGTPLDQNPEAFWIIMAVMLAAVGFMIAYFARKRWF